MKFLINQFNLNSKNKLRTFVFKCSVLALLLFSGFTASAQTDYYWIGPTTPGGNIFTNPNNWSTSPTGGTTSGTAPGDFDIAHFLHTVNPVSGVPIQTSVNFNGGDCGEIIVEPSAPTYQFQGDFELRGSFTANNNASFIGTSYILKFSGTTSESINLGPAPAINTATNTVDFLFSNSTGGSIADYQFNSDLPLGNIQVAIESCNINSNSRNISCGSLTIRPSGSSNLLNFSNSTLTFTNPKTGFFGSLQITANPTITTYNLNGAILNFNAASSSYIAFVGASAQNTSLIGISDINFNNGVCGIHTRLVDAFTIQTVRLNINTVNFVTVNSQGGGVARGIIRADVLNLNRSTVIDQAQQLVEFRLGTINTIAACGQMSILKSSHPTQPVILNMQNPISLDKIAFQGTNFIGSTYTAAILNDLGLNDGPSILWSLPSLSNSTVWTGAISNNWNLGANWSTGCVPTLFDDVTISSGPNPVINSTESAGLCRNLILNGGSSILTIGTSSNLYINGDADLRGRGAMNVSDIYFVGSSGAQQFFPETTLMNSTINFSGVGTYELMQDIITSRFIYHNVGRLNIIDKNVEALTFVSDPLPRQPVNFRNLNISDSEFELSRISNNYTRNATWYLNINNLQSFVTAGSRINLTSNLSTFNTVGIPLFSPVEYNIVEFTNSTGTSSISEGIGSLASPGSYIIDSLIFKSNANIDRGSTDAYTTNTVNDYYLASGKTYIFTSSGGSANRTFIVRDSIHVDTNQCNDLVIIKSTEPGHLTRRARLQKAPVGLAFVIESAIISDVNAIYPTQLIVNNGIDAGNNVNVVAAIPAVGREMFWRPDSITNLGTGTWNQGEHWAIKTTLPIYPVNPSDLDNIPAISNPQGCIPRPIDNVYFDDLSFNVASQSVTINNVDAYCRNMLWDNFAGFRSPRFMGTLSIYSKLNIYGSLEMSGGVNVAGFDASIFMRGTGLLVNNQSINTNNLTFPLTPIGFVGGGRYDLRSDITFLGNTGSPLSVVGASIENRRGNLFTNGFNMTARTMLLDVSASLNNTVDISNSDITVRGIYGAVHDNVSNFTATNSQIIMENDGVFVLNASYPITDTLNYCRVLHREFNLNTLNSMEIGGAQIPRTVNFERIEFETYKTSLQGNFRMDTLIYDTSSVNLLYPRNGGNAPQVVRYVIVDSLKAIGDPCRPIRIESVSDSEQARILYENCNATNFIEVRDGYIEDLVGLPSCVASNYRVVGSAIDFTNWQVTNVTSTLPASAAISCDAFPALLDASSFSPSWQYTWSTGETTDTIRINGPGTYTLDMYYDPTCFINQSIIITDFDIIPPTVTCPINAAVVADPGVCTYTVPDATYDATVTDNCDIDSVWVVLSGATTGTITTNTIQGISLNRGTTVVTWFANDQGTPPNISSCSYEVLVTDDQDPVFTTPCPSDNLAFPNTPGLCSANVSWVPPAGTDNCSAVLSTSLPLGSSLAVGTTTLVTYTLTDPSGNTATCSFNMAVIDVQDPTITPPANVAVGTDAASCFATGVSLGTPTTGDNCGVATVTNDAPVSFPTGPTTVTWTVTDIYGNTATSTQTVTVTDNVDPVITCSVVPDSVTTDLAACSYAHVGTAWDATASDNCLLSSLTYVLTGATTGTGTSLAGVTFNAGLTTITWTATDASANTATCVNTVTIFDGEQPTFTTCPSSTVIPTSTGLCTYQHTGTSLDPAISDNCTTVSATYALTGATTGTGSSLNGVIFNIGVTTVTWTVTDDEGNQVNTCFYDITVEDQESPVISVCPTDVVVNTALGVCNYTNVGTLLNPTATDNCDPSLTATFVLTGATLGTGSTLAGQVFEYGVTNVEWTITDSEGNISLCNFTVTVEDHQNPFFNNCPTNISVNMSGATCSNVVNWVAPTSVDNCPGETVVSSHNPGDLFPVGTTTVTYTVTDVAGNIGTCTFDVTVVDVILPVFDNCPTDMSSSSDAGVCGAVATWPVVTATDNCGISSITSTHNPGDIFPIGTTQVTYTAEDTYGNTTLCQFNVTVTDDESPVFTVTCPADNLSYPNDLGDCSATVSWIPPVGTDNCSATLSSNFSPGVVFNVGTTTLITYTLEDPAGNTATCSFNIGVIDNEDPTLVCPSSSTVQTDLNQCDYTQVGTSWDPISTDNCGTLTYTYVLSGATVGTGSTTLAGQVFNYGVTDVEWTITDNNGNSLLCNFSVTVEDNQLPVFVGCPSDISVNMSGAVCTEAVNWIPPTVNDNCPGETVVSSHNPGDLFPVGVTTVTYTVTDVAGNIGTCIFDVTVTDLLNPIFDNCPSNITLSNDAGVCGAVANWPVVTATDNCAINSLTSTHTSGSVFPIGTTQVTYTAEDTYGNITLCQFTVTVTDNEFPVISNMPSNIVGCENEPVSWIAPIATDNCGISSFTSTSQINDVFPLGTTIVTYTAIDLSGNTTTNTFSVIVNPLPVVDIEVEGGDDKVCLGKDVSLLVSNADPNLTYEWFDDFGNSLGIGANYTYNSGANPGQTTYNNVTTDINGCQSTDQLQITVQPCGITITEAVTPNGDGFNDVFVIENVEFFPGTSIKVFNRWGLEVYASDDYQNDWDVRSESKLDVGGDYLPEGTYYYLIQLGGEESNPQYGEKFKGYFFIKLTSN